MRKLGDDTIPEHPRPIESIRRSHQNVYQVVYADDLGSEYGYTAANLIKVVAVCVDDADCPCDDCIR